MGLRMAGTAIAAALTVAAILVFSSPRAAVGAPMAKTPVLVVTVRPGSVLQDTLPTVEGTIDATCLSGETVVGGGLEWGEFVGSDFSVQIGQHAEVNRSIPFGPLGWRVSAVNTSQSATIDLRATVMCAKLQ